jgi:hypothetical protein
MNHSHAYKGYNTVSSGSGSTVKSRGYYSGDPSEYGGEAFNGSTGNVSSDHTHTTTATNTGSTGGATAINNLQPYIVVYRYRRTA